MPFVVIEVPTPGVTKGSVRAFGPYDSQDEAEQARRRRHFQNWATNKFSPPRTFVAKVEEAL